MDWLSLQGAIRRLSFEHDMNWSDHLFQNMASAPADVDSIPLLKISLSSKRSMVLAAHGKRLVLFSDGAMVRW